MFSSKSVADIYNCLILLVSPIRSIAGKVVVFSLGNLIWRLGQAVKTPALHAGITGSNPVGVTTCRNVSKISHYSKPSAWVTNPTAAATVALTRKSSGIKLADVRLANLLVKIIGA